MKLPLYVLKNKIIQEIENYLALEHVGLLVVNYDGDIICQQILLLEYGNYLVYSFKLKILHSVMVSEH